MTRTRSILAAGVCVALLAGVLCIRPARAIDTTDILKVGGVLLAVNQFGTQINHFINDLLSQRKAELAGRTKVVLIFSVGQGAYIGAAQVVGMPAAVDKVQTVVAAEGVLGKLDGTLLVPISTKVPGSKLSKVSGVGVSAIVDIKL